MVSAMTFEQAAVAYQTYLDKRGNPQHLEAVSDLVDFLDHNDEAGPILSSDVRILLVAADFNREITTTVLWLNRFEGMDIRCVRLLPYSLDGKTFLDIDQVLPLAEAADYQVQVRRKEAERERSVTRIGADWTPYVIVEDGQPSAPLRKRAAMLRMVQILHQRGVSIEAIAAVLPKGRVRTLPGELASIEDVEQALTDSGVNEVARWYVDAPISSEGMTLVLSKMWGLKTEKTLADLRDAFPEAKVTFEPGTAAL